MLSPEINSFGSFNLTEEELKVGQSFNFLQVAWIQNLKALAAQDILNKRDEVPELYEQMRLERAYSNGQLAILDHILETAAKRLSEEPIQPQPQSQG